MSNSNISELFTLKNTEEWNNYFTNSIDISKSIKDVKYFFKKIT